MLFGALAVALLGFSLKLLAAQPAGWFLVPLAAVACMIHIRVHARADAMRMQPVRLAVISDICLLAALLMQVDFGFDYNCGWDTLTGVAVRLGLTQDRGCILLNGAPGFLVDVCLYIPAAVTWHLLSSAAREAAA